MATKPPTGALEATVYQATQDAVNAALAPILEALRVSAAKPQPAATIPDDGKRFVSMAEMCKRLGCNRTTILRRERSGRVPKRRTFPDGRLGWTSAEVDAWFAAAKVQPVDPARGQKLASRIHGH